MTHEQEKGAFLADICEHPDDDVLRMIYADWLDERGKPGDADRAEFIRTQITLARMREDDPQREHLEAREQELLREHAVTWERSARNLGATKVVFRRGFPEKITIAARAFVERAGELFDQAPIRAALIKLHCRGDLRALAASPHLRHFTSLSLMVNSIDSEGARILAASPHFRNLTALDLSWNGIGPEGARALAESSHLGQLTFLNLKGNRIHSEGARALADPLSHLRQLTEINLWDNAIDSEGARALVTSPSLTNITTLHLGGNYIEEHVLREIERTMKARTGARGIDSGKKR